MGLEPTFAVVANSVDITAAINKQLISINITDESGYESDTAEITLADNPLAPIALPSTGAELEIFLGYDGINQKMGKFVVDEVELSGWPATMTIRARASVQTKSKDGKTSLTSQKSRAWPKDTTLKNMVEKIAKEHGLAGNVSSSLASVKIPHTAQTDESDISFLMRIARRYDALVKPADGKLVVAKRGESKAASGKQLPAITINATECESYSMTLAKRDEPGTVIAYHHSKRTAKKVEVKVGEGEPVRRLRQWYQDEDSAKEAAQAEMGRRKRGEEKLSLSTAGNPFLCAESPLTAVGFRPSVDGEWLTTSVSHTLDKSSGYKCSIEAEKPEKK